MSDFFYHGVWRMDWGLGNPNKTAALIATLMIAVWALAYLRRGGFWIATALFTGLGVCLIHTYSRGGLIAVLGGLAPVLWFAPRRKDWGRIGALIASLGIMIGAAIYLDAHERYGQGVVQEDRSISHRMLIWKAVPAMVAAAPRGWGLGNAGNAYMQWYQPIDQNEDYRTLVNSHLTWLVEFGWPARLAYLMAWSAAFILCWPSGRLPWLAPSLGVVICFGIAAWFSSVAESPWLWIVPGLAVAAALAARIYQREWPRLKIWLAPPVFAVAAAVILLLLAGRDGVVQTDGTVVTVGRGVPATWVVVNTKTLGAHYGRALRGYIARGDVTTGAIGLVLSIAALPPGAMDKRIVLCGTVPDLPAVPPLVARAQAVILANPTFFPSDIAWTKTQTGKVQAIFGEFSQSPALSAWSEQVAIKRLAGVGDFLPTWPATLLSVGG